MSSKPAAKGKTIKKSTTEDDGRRRREANLIKIRKEKREEGMQKRRNLALALAGGAEGEGAGASAAESAGAGGLAFPGDTPTADASTSFSAPAGEVRLDKLSAYCEGESPLDRVSPLPRERAERPANSRQTARAPRAAPSTAPAPPQLAPDRAFSCLFLSFTPPRPARGRLL